MSSVNLTGKPNIVSDAEQAKLSRTADTRRARENSPAVPANNHGASGGDVISVSDEAATIGRLAERAAQLPEIRQEKVDRLREQIRAGAYRPTAQEIADAIIKSEQG
ncbi:MAG TPA: flagellar biosynthesis anti-sigma factor FlgM [Blastocatellia bacterium]|nr:flagellar biosynthesis anti-sigma factor FlgM [Blastocatellia bacterium]